MSLSRFSNLSRLVNAGLRNGVLQSKMSNFQPLVMNRFLHGRNPFDDSFFGVANSLMRNLEREFDSMRHSFLSGIRPTFGVPRISLPYSSEKVSEDLIATDEQGNRKFNLQFDMTGFEPEEIKVETQGQNITISAKKEKKSGGSYMLREFSHSYALPKDLKLEDLKSNWSDGLLTIEAPLPKQVEAAKKEKTIPISHKSESETSKQNNNNKK